MPLLFLQCEKVAMKSKTILWVTTLFWGLALSGSAVSSERPGDNVQFYDVIKVKPRDKIDHRVQISDPFNKNLISVRLRGPLYWSRPIGNALHSVRTNRNPPAIMSWYTVHQADLQADRTLLLADRLSARPYKVKLAEPMYLLSPAQRVTTGDPAAIPQDLNYFLAYRIKQGGRPVGEFKKLVIANVPKRELLSPYFVCLPVEERHHFDHFPVKAKDQLLVVYKATPRSLKGNVSILDQFGVNVMEMQSSNWIYIKGQILSVE